MYTYSTALTLWTAARGYEGSHRFGVGLEGQNLCQRWPLPARGEALQDNLRTGDDLQSLGGLWLDCRRHYGEDWQKRGIHQRRTGPARRTTRGLKACRFRTNISHSCSSNRQAGR